MTRRLKLDEKRGVYKDDGVRLTTEELLPRAAALEGVEGIESQFGWTRREELPSGRSFVLHTPPSFSNKKEEEGSSLEVASVPLLVYLPGSRNNAMWCALEQTRLIEKSISTSRFGEMVVVFLQAVKDEGEREREKERKNNVAPWGGEGGLFCGVDRRFQHLSFGEHYFEVLDSRPKFHTDLQYVKEVVDVVTSSYKIDPHRKFLVGHSNGGVFALQVLLHLPRLFTAVCSHQGGIGMEPSFCLDFDGFCERVKRVEKEKEEIEGEEEGEKEEEDYVPDPLLLFTGEKDIHLENCRQAKVIFEGAFDDYHPKLVVIPGAPHSFDYRREEMILDWLFSTIH